MTRKLYYDNPYIKEFTAEITGVDEKEGRFHLELDQTAFYPEGGGQPCDLGRIGDANVLYTYEDQKKVYHVVSQLPSSLKEVFCKIDWARRFDHMQQHLGQHILSAVLDQYLDTETIGFHLGSEYVTIDINRPLSDEEIERAEILTNQKVFNSLCVSAFYPPRKELEELKLRKLPSVDEDIRIVKIEDTDLNPCCGTHPRNTGEVGLVKVTKWEKYKSGMRLEFVCGNRALKDYSWKNGAINHIAAWLSVKDSDIVQKVVSIQAEAAGLRKENKLLREKVLELEAEEFLKSSGNTQRPRIIQAIFHDRGLEEIKFIASKLISRDDVVVLFGLKNQGSCQMIFSRSRELNEVNMQRIFKEAITLLEGRGGGNEFAAQGGGNQIEKLEPALNHACREILKLF